MDTGNLCSKSDVDHIVSDSFVRCITNSQFDQTTKDRIINYVVSLYGRDFVENALTACQNCAIKIENEDFTYFEYLEYLEDYNPVSAIGDLESLFKYIKVSDATKNTWEESVKLEPGEKYDIKVKFHAYTENTNIEGDVKFYLSEDKHFDTSTDKYLGEDTFTLRPGEEEQEYLKGVHAPGADGNYYIFCRVRWNDNNKFYSQEYAKIEVRTPNYKPNGYIDTVSCSTISGWARDQNTTEVPITIRMYADGTAETNIIGSTVANIYRGDLPYTDKYHGFSFIVPNSLKDGQVHSVYAYALDSTGGTNPLIGVARIVCASPTSFGYPVYRFWSSGYKSHFYTVWESEKDYIINNDPNWTYESVAWYAYPTQETGTAPVYRFWSSGYKSHFYTISESEKSYAINNDPNWAYEGISWYAYPTQETGTTPVYRFWSSEYKSHFYTISESEKNYIIDNDPHWAYESIAFYVPTQDRNLHSLSLPIECSFTATPATGTAPLSVNFTSTSSGGLLKWDFGDNSTSTDINPVHTYNNEGSYTVTLTVGGPDGTQTLEKPEYIEVEALVVPVTLQDAIIALKVLAGFDITTNDLLDRLDINNDNKIGMEDIIFILEKVSQTRPQ